MTSIHRYVLVDEENQELDYEFMNYKEAEEVAGNDHAVVRRIYEYSDSELVYTPNGSNNWPPATKTVARKKLPRARDI